MADVSTWQENKTFEEKELGREETKTPSFMHTQVCTHSVLTGYLVGCRHCPKDDTHCSRCHIRRVLKGDIKRWSGTTSSSSSQVSLEIVHVQGSRDMESCVGCVAVGI